MANNDTGPVKKVPDGPAPGGVEPPAAIPDFHVVRDGTSSVSPSASVADPGAGR